MIDALLGKMNLNEAFLLSAVGVFRIIDAISMVWRNKYFIPENTNHQTHFRPWLMKTL